MAAKGQPRPCQQTINSLSQADGHYHRENSTGSDATRQAAPHEQLRRGAQTGQGQAECQTQPFRNYMRVGERVRDCEHTTDGGHRQYENENFARKHNQSFSLRLFVYADI